MGAVGEKVSNDRQAWVPFLCARVVLQMSRILTMMLINDGEDNDNYDANDDKSHSKQRTVRIIMMMATPLMSRTQSSEWQSWWGGGRGGRWRPAAMERI